MRDNGYKNAAYAIAELMDNAIQTRATHVELLCGGTGEDDDISARLVARAVGTDRTTHGTRPDLVGGASRADCRPRRLPPPADDPFFVSAEGFFLEGQQTAEKSA
jgi:hypothetical protein